MEGNKSISVQEYLKKRNKPRVTCRQRLLVYINSLFALVGILSFFIFLFLVPFVIDPSMTAILAEFRGPVSCFVLSSRRLAGFTRCQTWISCREGCTKDSFRCDQIVIAYIPVGCDQNNDSLYSYGVDSNDTLFSQFDNGLNHTSSTLSCDPHMARLLVNVKGCGYPPQVDCQTFYETYGVDDLAFPCYYSEVDHTLAVPIFDWHDEVNQLALAIFVPFSLIFISVLYMGIMFCGWCHCSRSSRKIRQDSDLQSLHKSESSVSRMSVRSIRKSQESVISHISR